MSHPTLTELDLEVVPGGSGPDWHDVLAGILALAGLIVIAKDDGDSVARDTYIEKMRPLLVAWHSPRDDGGGKNARKRPRR